MNGYDFILLLNPSVLVSNLKCRNLIKFNVRINYSENIFKKKLQTNMYFYNETIFLNIYVEFYRVFVF